MASADLKQLGEVAHYAIDELGVTGKPRLQDANEIASDKLAVLPGDLLVSRLNPRRGHVFRVDHHDVPAIASTEFAVLRPRSGNDPRFVRYAVSSTNSRQYLDSHVRSSTKSHGRVEFSYIWNQALPVRPIEEQRRIADYLDTETARIDRLLSALEERRRLLWERFWAHVNNLVWMNDAVDVGLGAVLESAADGPFGSSLSSAHYVDDGPRVVRLGNVGRAEFVDMDRAHISTEHYARLQAHAVRAGDLIVAGLGDGDSTTPAGRACIIPKGLAPAIVKADCFRLRLTPTFSHTFAAWQLSSPTGLQVSGSVARGSTRPRLNLGLLRQLRLRLPVMTVQASVVRELDAERAVARRLNASVDRQAALLAERRDALITAAVTGELEV